MLTSKCRSALWRVDPPADRRDTARRRLNAGDLTVTLEDSGALPLHAAGTHRSRLSADCARRHRLALLPPQSTLRRCKAAPKPPTPAPFAPLSAGQHPQSSSSTPGSHRPDAVILDLEDSVPASRKRCRPLTGAQCPAQRSTSMAPRRWCASTAAGRVGGYSPVGLGRGSTSLCFPKWKAAEESSLLISWTG